MALFIFDFDGTIVAGHTHNILATLSHERQRNLTPEEQWLAIHHVAAVGPKGAWSAVIRELIAMGHKVAIASFNSFPANIPRFLCEVVGLTAEEVAQIPVVSWLPGKPKLANKNVHIEEALVKSHFKGNRNEVVLVDDDPKNVSGAILAKYRAILAADDTFFQAILQLAKELAEVANHPLPFFRPEGGKAATELTQPVLCYRP